MSGGTGVEMLDKKGRKWIVTFFPASGSVVPASQGPRLESGLSGGLHPFPKLLWRSWAS